LEIHTRHAAARSPAGLPRPIVIKSTKLMTVRSTKKDFQIQTNGTEEEEKR
jgi:hypothetical protein